MSGVPGPREVFEAQLRAVTGKQWDVLPGLYAQDAVVEQPFAKPEALRLEGREQISRHFEAAASLPLDVHARDPVVRDTSDPEVIVAECDYDLVATATGRRFTVRNIFVVRVRNGKIVWSRDYHDHVALAEVVA